MPRKDPLTQQEHAFMIASLAHEGQFRRDGKTPYIEHPRDVARRLKGSQVQAAGWLHDVWEETWHSDLVYDRAYLISLNVAPAVALAVDVLTHRPHEPNIEYWGRIKHNKIALAVKVADLVSNINDLSMTLSDEHLQVDRERQYIKYAQALLFFKAPNLLGLDPSHVSTERDT